MQAELNIEGMSCNMCVAHVTKALEGVDGVSAVTVSLEAKRATVDYDESKAGAGDMIAAVGDEGYSATVAV